MNFRNVLIIANKEIKISFNSPIAYIVIGIFLIAAGSLFFPPFFLRNNASLREFFNILPLLFTILVPAITMRLFSEELSTGSYELLATLPVTTLEIVLGKLFSAFFFVAMMLVPTIFYAICIEFVSDLEWGPAIGGYLGAFLLGCAYSGIGLFCSATTRNQIVALILGVIMCFLLSFIDSFLIFFPGFIVDFFRHFGANYHFQNISKGVVDFRDLLYFFSVLYVCGHLTYILIEEKKA